MCWIKIEIYFENTQNIVYVGHASMERCYVTAYPFKKGWKLTSFNEYSKNCNDIQHAALLCKQFHTL